MQSKLWRFIFNLMLVLLGLAIMAAIIMLVPTTNLYY